MILKTPTVSELKNCVRFPCLLPELSLYRIRTVPSPLTFDRALDAVRRTRRVLLPVGMVCVRPARPREHLDLLHDLHDEAQEISASFWVPEPASMDGRPAAV